jgi:hypothetical protein
MAPHLAQQRGRLALRQVVSSGELLPADLAGRLLGALPPTCRLLNLYGGLHDALTGGAHLCVCSLLTWEDQDEDCYNIPRSPTPGAIQAPVMGCGVVASAWEVSSLLQDAQLTALLQRLQVLSPCIV